MIPSAHHIKYFFSREELNFQAGRWVRNEDKSEPPLDVQVEAWIEKNKVQIVQASSPNICLYKGAEDVQLLFQTVAVIFAYPTENTGDEQRRPGRTTNDDEQRALEQLGRLAGTSTSGRADGDGVSGAIRVDLTALIDQSRRAKERNKELASD